MRAVQSENIIVVKIYVRAARSENIIVGKNLFNKIIDKNLYG
jgi:hypothetical protein